MPPVVIPRADHGLSRRDVDPDALKVMYRLKEAGFKAYLVGGSVRDLLLGRRPKDFDVGTDAHPHQVKRLFRNAFVIGRRFRLVHVRFGTKVIEVATFRRQVEVGEPSEAEPASAHHHAVHRDNTFGTDEEDAFRRDFTINALFYDIATLSIIDFVGGLDDLKAGLIRCIGEPEVRFHEDPVRMQRAVAFAARLGFTLDTPVEDAIRWLGDLLATAAPARLMDEYYKILRTGSAAAIFAALRSAGLLKVLSPVLHAGAGTPAFRESLRRLDAWRNQSPAAPPSLTNPIVLGSLIVPLGFSQAAWPTWMEDDGKPGLSLGVIPLARRDVERLHQMLTLQKRLREPSRSGHARHALMQRGTFGEALTWMELHGDTPEAAAFWRNEAGQMPEAAPDADGPRRRRRRSGRRRDRGPGPAGPGGGH